MARGYDDLPQDGSSPATAGNDRADKSGGVDDDKLVQMARKAYRSSTAYVDAELRSRWRKADRLFKSKHPEGSKYLSPQFRHRSSHFRPKTRSASRQAEAQAAQAFFSTEDVVSVTPMNDKSDLSRAAAAIGQEALNYRLNTKNRMVAIPWFQTVMGALQNARKDGLCVSMQWWEYDQRVVTQTVEVEAVDPDTGMVLMDPETGLPVMIEEEQERIEVITDRPRCDLIPLPNVRFDPGADWIDPVGTSPYLIIMQQMFVKDIKAKSKIQDPKTKAPSWREVSDDELKSAKKSESANDNGDKPEHDSEISDYDKVWTHLNFMNVDGEEVVFRTLGTRAMLTDPIPLKEFCWTGDRPIVIGKALIEANEVYPEGHVDLTAPIQGEINDFVNLRQDLVRFNLAPVTLYRRGAQVNVGQLTSPYPGKPVGVSDVNGDIRWERPPPPSAAGYQEEDRLSLAMDDVGGTFSQSSVQSNRNLNETVGGMQMLDSAAGSVGELDLRVFSETWAEPVLTQLMKLIQAYETDETILSLVAEKAEAWEILNVDPDQGLPADQIAEILQDDLMVTVNVGVGATSPDRQIQKFLFGLSSLQGIAGPLIQMRGPEVMESSGFKAIAEEVFGKLGYKDGARFLDFSVDGQDPMAMAMQGKIQELEQALQQAQSGQQEKMMDLQGDAAMQERDFERRMAEKVADYQIEKDLMASKAQTDILTQRAMGGQVLNVV